MGIFRDGGSNPTCDVPNHLVANAPQPFIGNYSFRQFNMILSGACTAIVCLSIFILMARHVTHFSKPNEQSKILRISFMLPVFTVLSFLSIAFPNAYVYLDPWRNFWESIALGSFFLLLCEFVSPSANFRDVFFAALEVPASRKARQAGGSSKVDGLEWYRKRWILVFQYVIVSVGVAIATDITQALNKYCFTSSNIHFTHLWLNIIHSISLAVAVISCIKFYGALKKDLKHHKPLAKFLSFKLIVGLTFLEQIVSTILRSTGALKESSTMTYADVNIGIETMVLCVLMVPFSLFFHYSYSVAPYDITKPRMLPLCEIPPQYTGASDGSNDQFNRRRYMTAHHEDGEHYYGGPLGLKAWLVVFDPREILRAIRFSFTMRNTAGRMGREVVGVQGPAYPPYR